MEPSAKGLFPLIQKALRDVRFDDPSYYEPKQDGEPCDNCEGPMMGHACKLICTRCGFRRDCSDA